MKLDENSVREVFSIVPACAADIIIIKLINYFGTTDPICYLNWIAHVGYFSFGTLFSVALASV